MIYVYLASSALCDLFLQNAEKEGFTFGDGVKPAERERDDIFALNNDWTINYVGFVGHMAFANANNVINKKLIRVDYGKYLSGNKDYIIKSYSQLRKEYKK